MAEDNATFMVEDARIVFRNFEGKEGEFNREGDRNFGLLLTDDLAAQLLADGWNVKYLKPREEGDEPQPWLPVDVKYKFRPPRIVLITNDGKTRTTLTESMVAVVDQVEIEKCDLVCRAYVWGPINGKSGIKAYLQTMFITVHEDALEKKYARMAQGEAVDD